MVRPTSIDKNGLKKGAWSEEEDDKLRAYIQRYGHWNWRLLPRYAGLSRCGKSCRLRWVNYLKPGTKHGNFNKLEEELIIKLHNQLGNKWSAIAAKLPGRTDNEIKNFWHANIKRRNYQNMETIETSTLKDHVNEPSEINPSEASPVESNPTNNAQELEISEPSIDFSYDTNSPNSIGQTLKNFWTSDTFLDNHTPYDHSEANNHLPPLLEDEFLNSGIYPEFYYNSELPSFNSCFMGTSLDWIAEDSNNSSTSDSSAQPFVWNGFNQSEIGTYFSSQGQEGEVYDHCFQYFDHGMDLF